MKAEFLETMSYIDRPSHEEDAVLLHNIRVFAFGWVWAMKRAGINIPVVEWIDEFPCLCDNKWRPDASWKWWDNSQRKERSDDAVNNHFL